jgi:hypothetical protein
MVKRLTAAAALVIAMSIAPPELSAQRPMAGKRGGKVNPKPRTQLELLQRMSPEERRRLLNNLPPERKRVMEQRLRDLERMTPEERRQARRMLDDFQSLPPERRQAVRRLFVTFNRMPEERRGVLREEMRTLSQMNEDERQERMGSEQYRTRYSQPEQEWLANLTRAVHGQ